jgi:radical SAM superfamily enzyme YgiQ (UPF0313 family)
MRILVMQFRAALRGRPVPRFDPQLGTLLTLLAERGHELALVGISAFDLPHTKAALARTLPTLIYADIDAVCVDIARRTLEYLDRHEYLPVVAGGIYPTIDPTGALSLPGVQAAALGEPDASLVTYLERVKDPAVGQVVSGVWLRDEKGTAQPALPPLVEDLDSLPLAERELFAYRDYVARSGQIEIAVGRGNPQRYTYATDPAQRELYADQESWVRRRSPGHVLEEIRRLRQDLTGVRQIRFLDPAFALDADWLHEFFRLYASEHPLPFRCHMRANAATPEIIRALRDAGCQLVDLDVISGSDFIRNEVFNMELAGDAIHAACEQLRKAEIRTRAVVYAGAPYDSETALDDTRQLLLDVAPDIVDVRPYYPWPGTAPRTLCQEQGWLHARGAAQSHRELPGIDMPACRPDIIMQHVRRMRTELPTAQSDTWWRRWTRGQVFSRKKP